jgi:hypothetical protein
MMAREREREKRTRLVFKVGAGVKENDEMNQSTRFNCGMEIKGMGVVCVMREIW